MLTFWRAKEHWGIIGLWSGLVLGMFIMVASLLFFVCFRVDWNRVSEAAWLAAQQSGKKAVKKANPEEVVGLAFSETRENCESIETHAKPDKNVLGRPQPAYEDVTQIEGF